MKVNRHPTKIIGKWKVPSKSEKGVFHQVVEREDGSWECDCPAIKECRHIKIIQNSIKGLVYEPENYPENRN